MATMIRKQVYIEERQQVLLKHLAEEMQQSEAELIRAALDEWLDTEMRRRRALQTWQAEKSFIKTLLAQGSVEGGRTWARSDIYEERVNKS